MNLKVQIILTIKGKRTVSDEKQRIQAEHALRTRACVESSLMLISPGLSQQQVVQVKRFPTDSV